ncbi:MAG: sugar phosphate isomerase/epimerase [Lentisphaerae bacterium]|jgi:sugar phosphate isomerase/epimerase|nr:sugar phosphate isomerase/epimerase [Lentisphaerota bacterium]
MKLATTTGEFSDYSESLAEVVACFEGTGFRNLDLSLYHTIYNGSPFLADNWKEWIEAGGVEAERRGVTFMQAHSPNGNPYSEGETYEVFIKATIRSIEACGILGIPHIIVHHCDIGGYPSAANRRLNLERNRDFFVKLFPMMERTGVRVLLENGPDTHAPTPHENRRCFGSLPSELLELREFLNHPLIATCWDTGHANIQQLDQYESIMELGEALHGVHIADNYGDVDSHVSPFMGTVNIDSVMQGLLDSGYKGYFTFESNRMLHSSDTWPHYRRKWSYKGEPVERLAYVPRELKWHTIVLQYQIGKHILSTYGCYEE